MPTAIFSLCRDGDNNLGREEWLRFEIRGSQCALTAYQHPMHVNAKYTLARCIEWTNKRVMLDNDFY